MKKIFAALLLIAMMVSLCACGGETQTPTTAPTEPAVTDPTASQPTQAPTEPEPTEPTGKSYTVKVLDEGGNPVSGVKVQICDSANLCKAPKTTNEQGIVVYENQAEGEYKAQLNKLPEGYESLEAFDQYYPFGDATEVTIYIKAIG